MCLRNKLIFFNGRSIVFIELNKNFLSMNLREIIEKVLLEEEDSLSGKLPYSINVYGKEGKNPHLHYKINGIEGCIRLDIPRYFCHESYHEDLPSKEKKIIINWLKFNWLRCVQTWNKDSNQDKLPEDISKMPNYYLLPNLQPNGKLAKEDRK